MVMGRQTSEPSDEALAAAAQAGDSAAFDTLVRRWVRPLHAFIWRSVLNDAVAEDLTQETFLRAFRYLASYDPKRPWRSWCFRIAVRVTYDHLKRRIPEIPYDDLSIEPECSRDDDMDHHATADAVRRAVATLDARYRTVLIAYYVEGLTYEEMSIALGLPLNTVRTHLYRAKAKLRELLTRDT